MKIVVTEEIETVGWDEAMNDAPKAIADCLRAGTKDGRPVVCGKIKDSSDNNIWVVVDYAAGRPSVIQRATETVNKAIS